MVGEWRSEVALGPSGSGQRDLVWAVDLSLNREVEATPGRDAYGPGDGRVIIDAASFPGTPADVMSEIEAILRSIAVGYWG